MSRLALTFECQGCQLAGTLDTAPGKIGLLIVSGGNEVRSGAFSGQSQLAAKVAAAGFPVFRFDRRGIGDSDGENRGFASSRKDIAAALDAFRAMCPQMDSVAAFGNCDAASALMLSGGEGCDALILSNPWTFDEGEEKPDSAAIRSRYSAKLKSPKELVRLITGKIDLRKLLGGIRDSIRPAYDTSSAARDMESGVSQFDGSVRFLLAMNDRTAQAFEQNWERDDQRIQRCNGASHAYVEPDAADWLEQQILIALRS